MAAIFLLEAVATGCGGVETGLDVAVDGRYDQIRANLLERHLVNGTVVSLGTPGKSVPNNRDALLHTSLTMAALPCADAPRLLAGIAALEIEPGRYVRYFDHPPNDQISRDMIVGLVFALGQKHRSCPALRPEITGRMRRLLAYVERHDGSLGVGPASRLTGASRAAIYFAGKLMGLHPGPSAADRGALMVQATVLPLSVLSSGLQFYAVHLTALELILWTWADPDDIHLKTIQGGFCQVTGEFGNPFYDGLCGRLPSVRRALQQWNYSCVVYRWQEGNPWASCEPAGIAHPGHDFLLLYQLYINGGMAASFVVEPKLGGRSLATPIEEVLSPYPEPRGPEWAW